MRIVQTAIFAAATGLLCACVTASAVVSLADGSYTITGHASGGLNAGKGTAEANAKAAEFCASQHKVVAIQNTEFHGMAAVGGESTTLVFRCVEPH